eukprot:1024445-Amphidinium_carterae.3
MAISQVNTSVHTQYQQPSGKGKSQNKRSNSQHKGKGKSSITCWTYGRAKQPPMLQVSARVRHNAIRVVVKSQVCGVQAQSSERSSVP